MDHTHQQLQPNISEQERNYSLLGAGAFLISGLRHLSLTRMAIGGYLAYRGTTGHCPIRHGLEQSGLLDRMREAAGSEPDESFGGPRESLWKNQKPRDEVEEASMESFPASDPPNYTRGE